MPKYWISSEGHNLSACIDLELSSNSYVRVIPYCIISNSSNYLHQNHQGELLKLKVFGTY